MSPHEEDDVVQIEEQQQQQNQSEIKSEPEVGIENVGAKLPEVRELVLEEAYNSKTLFQDHSAMTLLTKDAIGDESTMRTL